MPATLRAVSGIFRNSNSKDPISSSSDIITDASVLRSLAVSCGSPSTRTATLTPFGDALAAHTTGGGGGAVTGLGLGVAGDGKVVLCSVARDGLLKMLQMDARGSAGDSQWLLSVRWHLTTHVLGSYDNIGQLLMSVHMWPTHVLLGGPSRPPTKPSVAAPCLLTVALSF